VCSRSVPDMPIDPDAKSADIGDERRETTRRLAYGSQARSD
jgi:hypothetical protein